MKEIFIKSFDSLKLSLAIYEAKKPKAVIQVIHGMCEHKERYDEMAKYLQKKNYTVVLSDNRGHGKSILSSDDFGYFGNSNGTKALVEDQKKVNDYIKKHGKPPKKVRLYHLIDKNKYSTYEEAQVIHIKM